MILTAHVARLHFRDSMNNFEYVSYIEEVEELVGSWLHTILEELVELKSSLHAILQRGALASSRPVEGIRLKDLSKHRLVVFIIHSYRTQK